MVYFAHLKDNVCDNVLDLTNKKLIVDKETVLICKWLISAQDDDGYITLEFLNLHVK